MNTNNTMNTLDEVASYLVKNGFNANTEFEAQLAIRRIRGIDRNITIKFHDCPRGDGLTVSWRFDPAISNYGVRQPVFEVYGRGK